MIMAIISVRFIANCCQLIRRGKIYDDTNRQFYNTCLKDQLTKGMRACITYIMAVALVLCLIKTYSCTCFSITVRV